MPCVTMIAGPNGSGKSTLIAQLKADGINFGEYLNADDMAAGMAGSPEFVALQAQTEVRRRRQQALDKLQDHSFETVLSHPSHLDHLRLARTAGFDVIVYFVATDDPLINIGRVANRVQHGGHNVPTDRIASRYFRSLENLGAALAVADEAAIFDNSSTSDPMRLVATLSDGILTEFLKQPLQPIWWCERIDTYRATLRPTK